MPARVGTVQSDDESTEDLLCYVHTLRSGKVNLYKVALVLNGQSEIDTGAAVSIIPAKTRQSLFPTATLDRADGKLLTYTAKPIPVLGKMFVEVKYDEYEGKLALYVVEGDGPALVGRDWLSHICLDWASIKSIAYPVSKQGLERLLDKYSEIFQPGLGTMTHVKAHLTLQPDATPKFYRPRSVPFAIKEKVGKELDKLEEMGVLWKVDHADWAAPIVPVPKKDGSIRVCGDYKVTINSSLRVDQYPLPKPADLMTCLTGGQSFSKLDLHISRCCWTTSRRNWLLLTHIKDYTSVLDFHLV